MAIVHENNIVLSFPGTRKIFEMPNNQLLLRGGDQTGFQTEQAPARDCFSEQMFRERYVTDGGHRTAKTETGEHGENGHFG